MRGLDERVPSISRRSLIEGACGIAALAAIGGVSIMGSPEGVLRPPGAQDEGTLLARCIRCDRCRSVCPHGAIDVATLEDGIVHARTPKMNFNRGYCDFCEGEYRCAEACPTEAIVRFDERSDKIGVAKIDAENCLLWRSGGVCSKRCIEACLYDALSIDLNGFLVVDESRCNGCGACQYVCPSASYQAYNGSNARGINVGKDAEEAR